MRRSLVLFLFVASCGPAAPSPRVPAIAESEREEPTDVDGVGGRAPTAAEERAIAPLLRIAERIRHLRFARSVPFRIQSRTSITHFVRSKIDGDEIERARIFYVALGLLDPELDVGELLVRVLGEQVVGYYDPDHSVMVLRDDVARQLVRQGARDRELGEAEMVIVHELVHALQDQRLALGEHYHEERSIDGENAFAALVEGDATLAMIGHLADRAGRSLRGLTRNAEILRSLVRSSPRSIQGQEIEQAPPIVRLPLVSRYLDGMVFCATLHGARGWNGVDDAHRSPPSTTEQVLHPERYQRHEAGVDVTLPALPELGTAGYAPHDEDSLGELETSIYFALGRGALERDESAAEGWGGDRLRVYRNDAGSTAVVWFTTWDGETDAREAEAAAQRVAGLVPESRRPRQRVERIGRAVLILRDLPPDLHEPVRNAFRTFAARFSS